MLEASRSCEQFKMSRKVPGLQAQRSRFDIDWVAVKELKLSYQKSDTTLVLYVTILEI